MFSSSGKSTPNTAKSSTSTSTLQYHSVMQIHVRSRNYNVLIPYAAPEFCDYTGSGVWIEPFKTPPMKMLLTNAHVIQGAVRIFIVHPRTQARHEACVYYQDWHCDLALISPMAPNEFTAIVPMPISVRYGAIGDSICAIGYPGDSSQLCVSFGHISRLEVRPYENSQQSLLSYQIDNLIEGGSSGGPIVHEGHLIGVVSEFLKPQVSFAISLPVVEKFLSNSVKPARRRGFPVLEFSFQPLENPLQKSIYGLGEFGVLVTRMIAQGCASRFLKKGDIVLEINGKNVTNQGTINYSWGDNVGLEHEISMLDMRQALSVIVQRGGVHKSLHIPLKDRSETLKLVPLEFKERPYFYIDSGMIVTVLTEDFIVNSRKKGLEERYMGAFRDARGEELVVISDFLPDAETQGYEEFKHQVIRSINNEEVLNLQDFVKMMSDIDGGELIAIETDRNSIIHLIKHTPKKRSESLLKHEITIDRYLSAPKQVDIIPPTPPASLIFTQKRTGITEGLLTSASEDRSTTDCVAKKIRKLSTI